MAKEKTPRVLKYCIFRLKEGSLILDYTFDFLDTLAEAHELLMELGGDMHTLYIIQPVYVDRKMLNSKEGKLIHFYD